MSARPEDRDWTLRKYRRLCEAVLARGYRICTVQSYIESPLAWAAILRHDVDRFPANALRMARVEQELGIRSTYYVRMVRSAFDPNVVRSLAKLGHEVGYHYEVLAKTRGDVQAALELLGEELGRLREFASVHTAAAHGSPLSRWNNFDIWRHAQPKQFGLVGEAYRDIDYSQVAYYTDTGRSWSANGANLRDRVESAGARFPPAVTTEQLIGVLYGAQLDALCIQTHPERWSDTMAGMMRSASLDFAANTTKRLLRAARRAR